MSKKKRRDGSGSVFQDGNGRWIAQIRRYDELKGESRKTRRRARSRDHARELLAELNATGATPINSSITLAEYLTNWLKEVLPIQDRSTSTKALYSQCLTYYGIPAAGEVPLTKLTPSMCEQWLDAVRSTKKLGKADPATGVRRRDGDPIAASTVRNTYMAALQALNTAVRDGVITSNPLAQINTPRVPKAEVPATKPHEIDALLKACAGRRIEPLVYFVAWTGCRIGEALALRWADVDLEANAATLRRGSRDGNSTKTGKIRDVTLLPEVVDQLKAVRARSRRERLAAGAGWHQSNLVFTSATGRPLDYDNVSHELRRALKAAGLSTRRPWHSLRHGFSHRLLAKGFSLPLLSAMLGHSSLAITVDTYGHVDSRIPQDVLAQALER